MVQVAYGLRPDLVLGLQDSLHLLATLSAYELHDSAECHSVFVFLHQWCLSTAVALLHFLQTGRTFCQTLHLVHFCQCQQPDSVTVQGLLQD